MLYLQPIHLIIMSTGARNKVGSKQDDPPYLEPPTVRKRTTSIQRTGLRSQTEARLLSNNQDDDYVPVFSNGTCPTPTIRTEFSSTPATSPTSNTLMNDISPLPNAYAGDTVDDMADYYSTPITQSVGARLLPSNLPVLNDFSSIMELNDYIDVINERLNAFAIKLTENNPNWKSEILPIYKDISAKINKARTIAADKSNDALLARCSELMCKLDEAKMKWSSQIYSESSLQSFHGFNTSTEPNNPSSCSIKPLGSTATRLGDLVIRLGRLESDMKDLSVIRSKIKKLSSNDNTDAISAMVLRISKLESQCDEMSSLFDLQNQFNTLEARLNGMITANETQKATCDQASLAQRSLVKELILFKDSTNNSIENLQYTVDQLISNSNTQSLQDNRAHQPRHTPITATPEHSRVTNGKLTASLQPGSGVVNDWLKSQQASHHQGYAPPSVFIPPVLPTTTTTAQAVSGMNHARVSNGISRLRSESSSVESVASSALDIQGRLLKTQMNSLKRLLSPDVDKPIQKAELEDLYRNRLFAIESKEKELSRSLQYYLRAPAFNVALSEKVADIIDDSSRYVAAIRSLYLKEGHHMKSQSAKLYEALPQFSCNSDIDIFEFLKRYDAIAKDFDIPFEKAELLYSKFLSSAIQEEVVRYKGDYATMKSVLLQRYGNLKTITMGILNTISKESIPSQGQDVSNHVEYYRKLQFVFQKVKKLLTSPDVPAHEVEDYLFSNEFITKLMSFLPQEIRIDYIKQLQRLDEDTNRIRGKIAFKVLVSSVNQLYELYDTSARNMVDLVKSPVRGARKEKSKVSKHVNHLEAAHSSDEESDQDDDNEVNSNTVLLQQNQLKGDRPQKPVSKLKFPCIVEGHNHSLGECEEFFSISPKERVEHKKKFRYKYCTLCLQSSNDCQLRKCANVKYIPRDLKCKECKDNSKMKKRSWYSVLFCFSEKHTKPSNDDIIKALDEYVPKFNSTQVKVPVNIACHFQVLQTVKSNTKPKPVTKSRPVDSEESVPSFNTRSGILDNPKVSDVIKEVDEDSISIMQLLNIQGKSVLVLFDSGANQNLIDGPLAEELKIKVISEEPSAIGVVSGGQIWTEYGQYQLAIGPTPAGRFYEIKAQGISAVTGTFPKYNLSEVNKDVRESADFDKDQILPSYIGGDKIKILIGLKNAQIEPTFLFSLECGLGVYRSPFTDMFGSNICFGGPHSSFSSVNKSFSSNINHFNAFLLQTHYQYSNSFYPSLIRTLSPEPIEDDGYLMHYKEPVLPYSYQSASGHDIYPTPLTSQDFIGLGKNVVDEMEADGQTCPEPHCECTSLSYALKAKVPLRKKREYIDENDIDSSEGYRCQKCARCRCNTNNRIKMMSLLEQIEQEAIEKSVTISLEEKKVYVDLPFTKPPGEFLTARHGGDNNYNQALRVYKSQCRLPESRKEHIRVVHADLVSKGFLKNYDDLSEEHKNLIVNSEFKHYMPWRCVLKDSSSTPLRLVVDPSQSGLNLILAKGENRLSKINDILTRARTKKYIWSSDISKLYNRLHLKPTSYAYQLFLYHDELNPDTPPQTFVMIVAWYGVTPSSNQSGYALEELARLFKDKCPRAYIIIIDDRYVDDIFSGDNSKNEVFKQIDEVKFVLDSGGFSVKFVILSGESGDEEFLKVLGYKWYVLEDKLSPGFSELNFNAKKRGMKSPNPFPVCNPDDVTKLLSTVDLTRRIVISRIAELWEPSGQIEPYKLQLKLAAHNLNKLDWDSPLALDLQEYWIVRFQEFLTIPHLKVNRYIFPTNLDVSGRIRLLCFCDAATTAGGAVVYAGIKLTDGTYSCQLLQSKSKLMQESVPRNELNAIRIGANLVFDIKNALGDQVGDVYFFTDSSIAMSWVHNTKKKLRLFCLNRVTEIRNLIQSVIEPSDDIPLYHVEGKSNIADLLTKVNNLKPDDIKEDSTWIQGYDWMKLDVNSMPVTSFSQLQLSASQRQALDQECFPEIYLPGNNVNHTNSSDNYSEQHCSGCNKIGGTSIMSCYGVSEENPHCVECDCKVNFFSFACKPGNGSPMLVDIVKHGYQRSIEIVSHVLDFIWSVQHRKHISKGESNLQSCKKCCAISDTGGIPFEYNKILRREALHYYLKEESKNLNKTLTKDKLSKFTLKEGVYYAMGRLPEDAKVTTEDLDPTVFFDNTEISGVLPVISADSPLFFSYLIHVHHKIRKHSGMEITLREIMKKFFVINNPRRIIQAVRKSCTRCRILIKKTYELEMAYHPQSRLQIAPPFYHCMVDIVYGFKGKVFKRSRTEIKIYGLVIVCLMSSATNILALEGIEAQDIIQAIERHSARYGVPAALFVDQGTQLACLEGVKVKLRDVHAQLRESIGIDIIPSAPKNHESRGRVERKILTLRDMLKKTAVNVNVGMTAIQWESIFAKMANEIDEIPMARADKSSSVDTAWDLLTPNRFKLGRSNQRTLQGPIFLHEKSSPMDILKKAEDIQKYWYQLLLDRLHHLIPRPSKWTSTDEINVDDIVLFKFLDNPNSKLESWRLGRIVDIHNSGRRVTISYVVLNSKGKDQQTMKHTIVRCPRDVCVISSVSDLNLNSTEFFNRIKKIN